MKGMDWFSGMEFAGGRGMVSWMERIRLTLGYGAGLLVLGGLFNAASAALVSMTASYSMIFLSLILKAGVTAASLYLNRQFENRDAVYFYINLGLNRRQMLTEVLAVDYLIWAVVVVIILLTR